jgi:hypothetical protein
MRIALIGTLLVSSTLVGTTHAAAVSYCSTSGGFGACASAGLGLGHGSSGPAVGLRNLTGVVGDAGYVLAGFALYYVGTHFPFGDGGSGSGATASLASQNGNPSVSSSSAFGRGSRLAPLRSANSLGPRNPRALAGATNGNGPINYTLSIHKGNGSSELPELTNQVTGSSNSGGGVSGLSGPAGQAGCTGTCAQTQTLSTTAPEPATMALMAIGLVGLAGAGYVQRRRQS